MTWTVIIPIKLSGDSKSRLAPLLDPEQRRILADRMYEHVRGCVQASGLADEIVALVAPGAAAVSGEKRRVQVDSDLNVELDRIRSETHAALIVLNADLPLLEPGDIIALAEAGEQYRVGIAPDRHDTGTNGIALLPAADFRFCFGANSLERHLAWGTPAGCVRRPGLLHDLDTLEDVKAMAQFARPLPDYLARLLGPQEVKRARAAAAAGE